MKEDSKILAEIMIEKGNIITAYKTIDVRTGISVETIRLEYHGKEYLIAKFNNEIVTLVPVENRQGEN